MTAIARRFFAVLSACGAGICIFIYIASLAGVRFDDSLPKRMFFGALAMSVPLALFECRWTRRLEYWKDSWQAKPSWARSAVILVLLVPLSHFFWAGFSVEKGGPTIQDGQFILAYHGTFVKALTESEYWALKGYEIRLAISLVLAVYLNIALDLWFPTAKRKAAAA